MPLPKIIRVEGESNKTTQEKEGKFVGPTYNQMLESSQTPTDLEQFTKEHQPRISNRIRRTTSRLRDYYMYDIALLGSNMSNKYFLSQIYCNQVPNSYEESRDNSKWVATMKQELDTLNQNNMWDLTNLLKGKKVVGCHWTYMI